MEAHHTIRTLARRLLGTFYKIGQARPVQSVTRRCTPIYQGAEREDLVSVRPADFLQKDFNITLPQKWTAKLFEDDAAYLPPEEMRALQTRQEVLDALEKSCEATEKFWRIWTDQYLTSLRETHKKSLTDRRHTQLTPKQVT